MADAYARSLDAMRLFHDRFVGSRPDQKTLDVLTDQLSAWSSLLLEAAADEERQFSGNRFDLPSRGRVMAPPVTYSLLDQTNLSATVMFGRYYLGANAAAHGGAVALVFDESLGRLANFDAKLRARTAYLNTNYRSVTPIDVPLELRGWITKYDGRKRFVRGELRHEGNLCAEADALFIELKPGQP